MKLFELIILKLIFRYIEIFFLRNFVFVLLKGIFGKMIEYL